jgi:predicted nucleotidyltransferase
MRPSDVLERKRSLIREVTARHNAANPRVFGSVARGEDRLDSDLDILVDALPGSSLMTLGGLQSALEDLAEGVPVHLVTTSEIPQKHRGRILAEARPI